MPGGNGDTLGRLPGGGASHQEVKPKHTICEYRLFLVILIPLRVLWSPFPYPDSPLLASPHNLELTSRMKKEPGFEDVLTRPPGC